MVKSSSTIADRLLLAEMEERDAINCESPITTPTSAQEAG
jgi:hypothetical protein